MAKRVKYLKNAPLEAGDEVVCVNMDDQFSPVKAGTTGVVKSVSNVQGSNVYYIKWDSGSNLALLEGVDQWRKVAKEDDDEEEQLSEGFMFFTTKRAIIKEIKK
jgi:hypothetical protein